jgi:hypothetical protein
LVGAAQQRVNLAWAPKSQRMLPSLSTRHVSV